MFSEKKVTIVNDAFIFTSNKNNLNTDELEIYFDNYNPDTIVIFRVNESSIDNRKKITKKIKVIGNIIEYNEMKNITFIVKEMFGNYNIDNNSIELLISRVGNNLDIINQEIIKIKTYKDDDYNITKEDILKLTTLFVSEDDMFKLVDLIIKKDINEAIKYYNELLKLKMEPIKIIVTLANKIRLIYQIKELFKSGYTENDIVSILKIKPGQIYYLKDSIKKYQSCELIDLLDKLATLDLEIKSGVVDKRFALELFILSL